MKLQKLSILSKNKYEKVTTLLNQQNIMFRYFYIGFSKLRETFLWETILF